VSLDWTTALAWTLRLRAAGITFEQNLERWLAAHRQQRAQETTVSKADPRPWLGTRDASSITGARAL